MNDENKNLNNNQKPAKNGFFSKIGGAFKTAGIWLKRMFLGASKSLSQEDIFAVEKLESPAKLAVKSFFRRRLQVSALIVIGLLFLFVLIGPLFIKMDYTADVTMTDMAPNLSLRSVPSKMKNNVKTISSYSTFSVGLSNDNDLYVWGSTKNPISKEDLKNIPGELQGKKVAFAAAGFDHIIAITTEGKVVGWGKNNLAQDRKSVV